MLCVCISVSACVLCFFFGSFFLFCLFCPILVFLFYRILLFFIKMSIGILMRERERETKCGFGWVRK